MTYWLTRTTMWLVSERSDIKVGRSSSVVSERTALTDLGSAPKARCSVEKRFSCMRALSSLARYTDDDVHPSSKRARITRPICRGGRHWYGCMRLGVIVRMRSGWFPRGMIWGNIQSPGPIVKGARPTTSGFSRAATGDSSQVVRAVNRIPTTSPPPCIRFRLFSVVISLLRIQVKTLEGIRPAATGPEQRAPRLPYGTDCTTSDQMKERNSSGRG